MKVHVYEPRNQSKDIFFTRLRSTMKSIPCHCMGYSRLVWDSQPSKWSSWCSWLSRQSNTLKVLGSNPGEDILFCFFPKALRDNRTTRATSAHVPATSRIDQEGLEASAGSLPSPNRWIFAICRVSLFFVPRGLQQDIPILNEKQLVQRRATRVPVPTK